jgi:chorismate mutase
MDKTLDDIRQEIDQLDTIIMEALVKRLAFMDTVKLLKQQVVKPTFDPKREQVILNKCLQFPFSSSLIAIYQTIMTEAKKLQQ